MKLTTEIRYAVRALCDMTSNADGAPVQVNSISERQCISPRYIEQIFQRLKKGGIIRSVRGPSGGYLLTRRPEEITLGDVVRAIDGHDIQLVACSNGQKGSKGPCRRYGKCVVSDVWAEASKRLNDYFSSVTLEAICEDARVRGLPLEVELPRKGPGWKTTCPYAA